MSDQPSAARCLFISYRKDDSFGAAREVSEKLRATLTDGVFFAPTDLPPGQPWPTTLDDRSRTADVVLVLVGKGWLHQHDEHGKRLIDLPDDVVRREIEIARFGPIERSFP